ncbi:PREDICTED: 1-acyl-sn-glycerol-3-phosphate acyltransferase alpha [Nicrophorus vespilloides]|uniref:1-acyl-sn-glycerol-3-phosphate acyltransferase n=1 Tax=Nicrophorus vespilloides TaxID=110193 RepID=A0ABM1MJT7_NICVS|nr:PREDICTED: 1-acyl-sn-glycerol-3-phosphate acyltransferase alpha [Nicrophorus vespilloides]XP_017774838.1 PREDICTED: 1-acyl-sn-glycerol-3-phosphate acyltransferase alpha [Nicrophorus vespilloides]XP_017774840.1 PREDICTED: 1-acyl-sn-glycerol-3-phosphate acyltransferase alpha [Nicrophorus vespilloides]
MIKWVLALAVVWMLLILAWKVSSVARFYIKFSIYAVVSFVSATCPIPLMLLRPKSSKNALFPAAALSCCAKYVLGLDIKIKGKENIVEGSGSVVLINHQSVVDLIVLAELWPVMERCTVISKKEIFYIWPFGLAAWLWGTIFIDRLNGVKAQDAINSTGEIIRSRRARVMMFPEGTRSQKEKLLPFKKGAFHLAIASKCPIQPIIVNRYKFLGPKRFDDGSIEVSILPPIATDQVSRENIGELIDKTYHIMQDHLDSLDAQHATTTPNNNIDKSKDI